MIKHVLLVLFACQSVISVAQITTARHLKIGDRLPTDTFQISNFPKKLVSFADFRDKALILDLWGVNCSGCIRGIPHMLDMQKKFSSGLQVIMVTRDSMEQVRKLALRSENVKNNWLPSITGEAGIASMFNYRFVPRHVWVDKNGIIRHIASSAYTTEQNVADFIAGKEIPVPETIDISIDPEDPAIVGWYPYSKAIGVYSYLAPASQVYSAGARSGLKWNSGSLSGMLHSQVTLKHLYLLAYQLDMLHTSSDRIIFNLNDNSLLEPFIADYITGRNFFVYELIANNNVSANRLFKYMQRELDFFAKVNSSLQKKLMTCLVIKRIPGAGANYLAKDTTTTTDNLNKTFFTATNISWSGVLNYTTIEKYVPHQVIDETEISGDTRVDISFDLRNWQNLSALNAELRKFGLMVVEELRQVDCIIIEEDKLF